MNYRAVAHFLARLTFLLAASQLLPIGWSLWYREPRATVAFATSALLTGALAGLLAGIGRGETASGLYRREGILIVVAGWALASIFGGLPYLVAGDIDSPIDALFEAASGFTTTGASILPDIEAAGRAILFWRCLTQWLGGLGIIVLFVALLSELGAGARFLYRLEVPGPTAEVLQPRVRESAIVLWKIYLGLTLAQTLLLSAAGLTLYDALNHSLSTLSTGGFSPRSDSVAAFDSMIVDVIVIVFMFIAGVNFSLFYSLRERRFNLFRDREFAVYATLIGAVSLYITVELVRASIYESPLQALRHATFQVTSLMTTTGFATANFDPWPDSSRALLLVVMVIGGCAGSTAGGVKVMRVLIGIKAALREARLIFSPNTLIPILIGGKAVPGFVSSSVAGFIILYFITLFLGSLLLTLGGADLVTAGSAALACLGNIGPGFGAVGPIENFAHFAGWEKLLLVLLMWLGRLEILAITALFTRSFWER